MTTAPTAWPRVPRVDGRAVAIAGVLALSLAVALLSSAWAGAAILAFGLVVIARPLDPFIGLVLLAGVASFVRYGDPNVSRDLAVVALLTGYALASLLASALLRRWRMPSTTLGDFLLVLGLTTAAGAAYGVLKSHSVRFIALETFPLLSLLLAVVIGGLTPRRKDLALANAALLSTAIASAALGYLYYGASGMRTQGSSFSPVPGFVAVVVLARMLFEPNPRPRLLPIAVFCMLIGHQILTFTRGYWIALLVAVPFLFVLYGWRGPGAGARWDKVLRTAAVLGAALVVLLVVLATSVSGGAEALALLGARFLSSFETKNTPETVSNIVRLVELRTTMKAILEQPFIDHGHGATLIVRQFFHPMTGAQWWVHQSYVMMWFKQGIVGLLALIAVLAAATRAGIHQARSPVPEAAGWGAASAACTVFVAIVGLTNYHFFMVTLTFLLALVWGIAMSLERPAHRRFVWRLARTPGDGRVPEPGA